MVSRPTPVSNRMRRSQCGPALLALDAGRGALVEKWRRDRRRRGGGLPIGRPVNEDIVRKVTAISAPPLARLTPFSPPLLAGEGQGGGTFTLSEESLTSHSWQRHTAGPGTDP